MMSGDAVPSSLRILVVDDDRDTVDSAALVLSKLGYETFAAYDAPSALKLAESLSPQAVLLDAAMPGYDGLRLARALRVLPATKDAVIVCISGYGSDEHRRQAQEAGCDHHFLKPIDDWQGLVHLIERTAGEKGLRLTDSTYESTSNSVHTVIPSRR